MPFDLGQEQRLIQEAAAQFARERLTPNAGAWDEDKHFPVDEMRQAASLGFAAIYVGEEHGGSGLTRLDAALVFEQLAQGCPTTAAFLSIHNMVAWMIDRFGDADQRARFLPRLVTMDEIASYCLTEPGAGSDAASLKTRAVRDGEDYVLTGSKAFISGAGVSDLYLVMARTGDEGARGVSAFLVPKTAAGLSFGANERKMGWNAQPTRQVMFDAVRVPLANRLGAEGEGFKFAMAGLDGGRINIAACSLGGAGAAIEAALAYVKERRQFGKAIVEFQNTQFALADMATELDAARLMVYRAAASLDARDPAASRHAAMAKRFATDTCHAIADRALQLFGGYGYLKDYQVERIVRDLRVHRILEGTNEIMRVIIARDMMGR